MWRKTFPAQGRREQHLTGDTVETTALNRETALFMLSDDERVRRIRRGLCKLDKD